MCEWVKLKIAKCLIGHWAGVWGAEPDDWHTPSRVLRSTEIDEYGHLDLDGGVYRYIPGGVAQKAIRRGDILIETSGGTPDRPVGRVALVRNDPDGPTFCSNFVRVLRTNDRIEPEYLTWLLVSLSKSQDILRYQQQTTGIINLNVRDFLDHEIIVPACRRDQVARCEVFRSVDTRITHTEALIAKQEQVRAGLMQDLFARGVDETGRLRPPREEAPELYHETVLGWLPRAWDAVPVRDIANVVRGSTPRPAKDPRYFDGSFVPWITVGELSREDWPYLETTLSHLTELGAKFSRLLPSETLVISNSGYGCGVPKLLKIDGCANDGIAALLDLSKAYEPLFLYYWFYSNIDTLRTRFARGNDQPNLNTDIIGNLLVPRPAKHEQKSIADRVWCVQLAIERLRQESRKLGQLRTALIRGLLCPTLAVAVDTRMAAE